MKDNEVAGQDWSSGGTEKAGIEDEPGKVDGGRFWSLLAINQKI